MRINPRRNPDQDVLHLPCLSRNAVQQVQLVEAVHHHPPDPLRHRLLQLRRSLVVPMEVNLLQREPGRFRHRQLTPGNHVQPQPFLVENTRQGRIDVRLRRIQHLRPRVQAVELRHKLPAPVADRRLVQHVHRRAVLFRQVNGQASPNGKLSLGINLRAIGQNVFKGHHQRPSSAPAGIPSPPSQAKPHYHRLPDKLVQPASRNPCLRGFGGCIPQRNPVPRINSRSP